jgi:hypothetical protein
MLTLLLASTLALAGDPRDLGGGGVSLHETYVPRPGAFAGGNDVPGPGWMSCIGGMGFGVEDNIRQGGDGYACAGERAAMFYGGIQSGWQATAEPFYVVAYASLGGGWIGVSGEDDYAAAFLYVRPRAAIGLTFDIAALEVGPYLMLPFPLLQAVDETPVDGPGFPHTGLEVTLLFGDFDRHRPAERAEPDERPLAIPGDEPPPPPPPPDAG